MLKFKVYAMYKNQWAWVDTFAREARAICEGKELVAHHGATAYKVVVA